MSESGCRGRGAAGPETEPRESFADRLFRAVEEKRSALVVGLDPVLDRLPDETLREAGAVSRRGDGGPGGPESFPARAAEAIRIFLEGVLDAVAGEAVAVKPNLAFFERYGAPGWECLSRISARAKGLGLLVIADGKRGDIGSTAEAYAEALLGDLPGTLGPHVDAATVQPYLGTDSVEPFVRRAREGGRGIFVLVRTSNPSAAEIQDLDSSGEPLYLRVARLVERWGEGTTGASGFASVGAVAGATSPGVLRALRSALPRAPFLVPGYGAQGATAEDLRGAFLPGGLGAVVNAARSVIFAYERRSGAWRDAVRAAAVAAREEIEAVRSRA